MGWIKVKRHSIFVGGEVKEGGVSSMQPVSWCKERIPQCIEIDESKKCKSYLKNEGLSVKLKIMTFIKLHLYIWNENLTTKYINYNVYFKGGR